MLNPFAITFVLAPFGRHHGGRGILLLLLVAAIAVCVVLIVQRVRDRRHRTTGEPPMPTPPGSPAGSPSAALGPSAAPMVATSSAVAAPIPTTSPTTPVERERRPVSRPPATGPSQIEARQLTKRYGEKLAVDHLSFDVLPGRVTGFLGPNGAGKSTTMRLIMGLDLPTGGSVSVNGRRYHDLVWPLHEVGALLEANSIHPGRSAYSHLLMLARTHHIARRRVDEVLQIVGLSSVARQRAGSFSLGMTQRLGIAAALLGDPGVLMFDEPMNGLDTEGIRWVRSLLRGLAAEGRTVFVSSHIMSEMALIADHVVVIGKGRLIADLPMDEFTSQHSHRSVRVRSPQLDQLLPVLTTAGATVVRDGDGDGQADGAVSVSGLSGEQVGELAWRHSILLHELAPQSASLEEAFIESTEGDIEFRADRRPGSVQPSDGTAGSVT